MSAPSTLETDRLILRRPRMEDAEAIFERYASDADVTRYVGWPRHREMDDTRCFLKLSDDEWQRWPAGPYLIFSRSEDLLLGSTGLAFETTYRAATGYVLARGAWGRGIATEALRAMVKLASELEIARLYALCHPVHRPSARVLEKCDFELEGTLRSYIEFPNLDPGVPEDALCYALILRSPAA